MKHSARKGLVRFETPAAKLVADAPGDEEMREHLDEMQANDGYTGSCIDLNANASAERKDE